MQEELVPVALVKTTRAKAVKDALKDRGWLADASVQDGRFDGNSGGA